jgi:hypothetical protein
MFKQARNSALALAFLFCLFCAPSSLAQCAYTTVSGTILDPNNIPYAGAAIVANLVPAPPGQPLCSGQPFSGTITTRADNNGTFAILLPPNASITPASTQWAITVNLSPGVAPPLGFGPISFTYTFTASGSTQSISSGISAASVAIARTPSGGSGIPATPADCNQFSNSNSTAFATASVSGTCEGVDSVTSPTLETIPFNLKVSPGSITTTCVNTAAVFCASSYAGTPDQQYTACYNAAIAVGATCDASMLLSTQNFASGGFLDCGNTSLAPMRAQFPVSASWNLTETGGTNSLVTVFPGCDLDGFGAQNQFDIINNSASGGAKYGFLDTGGGSSSGYFNVGGFGITQHQTGGFSSGIAALFGSMQDNSVFHDMLIFDSSATDTDIMQVNPTIGDVCCSATFYNMTTNGNSVGGTPLHLTSTTASTYTDWGINFVGGSFGQPRAGVSNIVCDDTSTTFKITAHFTGIVYMEPDHNGDTTTPFVTAHVCNQLWFDQLQAMSFVASTAKPVTELLGASGSAQQMHIGHTYCDVYAGSWVLPCTAYIDNPRGWTVMSNTQGHTGMIDTATAHFTGLELFRSGLSVDSSQQLTFTTPTAAVDTTFTTLDNGSAGNITQIDPQTTSGQDSQIELFRNVNTAGNVLFQGFEGNGTATASWQLSSNSASNSYFAAVSGQVVSIGHSSSCTGNLLCVGTTDGFTIDTSGDVVEHAGATLSFAGATSGTFGPIGATATGGTLNLGANASLTTAGALTVTSCSGCAGGTTAWSGITSGANTQTGAFSTTAPWTFSAAGVASTPGLSVTGAPYTGGNATTNFPQLYLNSGAAVTGFQTTGTAFGINAPSGFGGYFIDLFLNGGTTSLFHVTSTGLAYSNSQFEVSGGGTFAWLNKSQFLSSTDGLITMENNAGTGFTRLNFGGTAASNVGLASNGTILTVQEGSGAAGGLFLPGSSTVRVGPSGFTTAANTSLQTITGLSWTFPATGTITASFACHLSYSQATGTATVAFGVQAATAAPTNIYASGEMYTAAGTVTTGVLPTLATTTATNIVSGTPGATGTNYVVDLYGTFENPATTANTFNIMVSTSTAADAVSVLRGGSCGLY